MPWLVSCRKCGYRIVSKKKKLALKFIDLHIIKSHVAHNEDFDDIDILVSRISREDYEIIRNIPGFPALII